jgi:glycosyltransferase involved in cell wall biosynthesis
MDYDVTIGIPVYNSVDYIRRAMDSALAQTYSSIEFLIVDDAGHDGTIDVVQSIKETHPRGSSIHIINHKENLGVAASRNDIIENAQGKYLYFMDSDDAIAENTIELMMQNVCKFDAEIVFGSYIKIDTSGEEEIYQYPALQLLKKNDLASFAYRKYAGIQASACNYLVKTSILRDNNHRFIDTSFWEDMVFTFDLVTFISRAVLLPNITYSYYCRENSLSNYQQREIISKDEILNNVRAINHLKRTSSQLYAKAYFPNRCYNIVMTDFYIACNILKRRNTICPPITNREIKSFLIHPVSWTKICSFRQSRLKNLLLYFLGKLPPFLCVLLIMYIGKLKKII